MADSDDENLENHHSSNDDGNENNQNNSASKNKSKDDGNGESCHQLYRYEGDDTNTDSYTGSISPIFSEKSIKETTQLKMAKARRRTGRITKRKRPVQRRKMWKAKARLRQPRKFSVKSPAIRSRDEIHCCVYCGHSCCRTRYMEAARAPRRPRRKSIISRPKRLRKGRVSKPKRKNVIAKAYRTELVQVGSRSAMLSPLFIGGATNTNTEVELKEKSPYAGVTPEIIYESLRKLTTWRQSVTTAYLLNYIQRTYPVNREQSELWLELKEKLRVANLAGIVQEISEDTWCLRSSLQNLTSNHVTLFWEAYGDTLTPIKGRKKEVVETQQSSSQTDNVISVSDEMNE